MSFGKSKTTEKVDPKIHTALLSNVARAKGIANTPYQPYTGQRVAGFDPAQQSAQQGLLSFAGAGVGSGLLSRAADAAGVAAGYRPSQANPVSYAPTTVRAADAVSWRPAQTAAAGYDTAAPTSADPAAQGAAAQVRRGDIRDIAAGMPITAEQIGAYYNPYAQGVIDTSLGDLERQRRIQQTLNAADARKAHAFGGTGAAVAAGLTNDTFARQSAQTSAQLRSQGYDAALAAAQSDAARRLQADQTNQSADLQVGQTNAGLQNTMSLANLAAANQRGEFNTGLAQQTALANQQAANAARLADADAAGRTSLANAQGMLTADTTNAGAQQTRNLADADAANQAARFGAQSAYDAQIANQQAGAQGAQLNLQAAQALAGFSDQQRGQMLQDLAQAQSVGEARQKLQQALLDAGFSDYQAAQQWPILMQQLLNSSVGLLGNPTLSKSTETKADLTALVKH